MAVKNLETLVLHGVPVVADVNFLMKRGGFNQVGGRPAAFQSPLRYPIPSDPRTDRLTGRRSCAGRTGQEPAGAWAGRPGLVAGVRARRSPASLAGRTVLGWSLAMEEPGVSAVMDFGPQRTKVMASASQAFSGHEPITPHFLANCCARQNRLTQSDGQGKREVSGTVPTASTCGS